MLGLAHQREGNLSEARTVLERGVQLDPDYVDFDTALGLIAEAQERFDDARLHYTRAVALAPDDLEARARALRVAVRAGGQ